METVGIEPTTPCMSSMYSNHLSYASATLYIITQATEFVNSFSEFFIIILSDCTDSSQHRPTGTDFELIYPSRRAPNTKDKAEHKQYCTQYRLKFLAGDRDIFKFPEKNERQAQKDQQNAKRNFLHTNLPIDYSKRSRINCGSFP